MNGLTPFVMADLQKCTGCKQCEVACHTAHNGGTTAGNVNTPILSRLLVSSGTAPLQCRHCEDAPCARVCRHQAITIKNGQVWVNNGKCQGCGDCASACPFGAIRLVPDLAGGGADRLVGSKCDLCFGRDRGPACVEACPEQALHLIDPRSERQAKNREAALTFLRISVRR